MAEPWRSDAVVAPPAGAAAPWQNDPIVATDNSELRAIVSQGNQVIADVLGAPGDLINWGARQLGADGQVVGGSEEIADLMRSAGIAVGEQPQTKTGQVLGGAVAGATSVVLPYAVAQRFLASGSAAAQGIARAFGTQPGAQLAAGAGAGAGAEIGRQVDPESPVAPLVGALAGGVVGAGAVGAAAPANPMRQATGRLLADYAAQGVDPTLGAVGGQGARIVQNTLGQVPGAAGVIQRAGERTVQQLGRAAENVAGMFGAASGPQAVGRVVQEGVERFARGAAPPGMTQAQVLRAPVGEVGFNAKSQALYQRLDQAVPDPQALFPAANTVAALGGRRFDNPALQQLLTDPALARWGRALQQAQGALSWNDLRAFRTEVGALLDPRVLRADVNEAQLRRLYGALSEDIEGAAAAMGSQVQNALRTADRYYAAGMERINGALKRVFGAAAQEDVYRQIVTAAGEGGSANAGKLFALKRSLPRADWNDLAATVVERLGLPTPGARSAENEFSVATFLTNYSKLSPAGRLALFGGEGQQNAARALDQLVNVVSAEKALGRARNTSNTGQAVILTGVATAAWNSPAFTALSLIGANGAARLMTWPPFVRALAAAFPGAGGNSAQWQQQMRSLQRQAAATPGVAQAFNTYLQALESPAPAQDVLPPR